MGLGRVCSAEVQAPCEIFGKLLSGGIGITRETPKLT